MTKVNCTYAKCEEQGSAIQGKRNGWEYNLCSEHAKKLKAAIEQTGPYTPRLKLNPPKKKKTA